MSLWKQVVDNYSPFWIEFGGLQLVQIFAFWVPCTIYLTLHKVAPRFSQRHKLQPAEKQPTTDDVRHCLKIVVRNQLFTSFLQVLTLLLSEYRGKWPHRITAELPSVTEVLRDVVICSLLREILFYYAHRAFHNRKFYSRFHKQHHKFTAPVALAAQYAHPLEHLVANVLPITIPPEMLHSHIITVWCFIAFQLVETSTVHSGYDFFSGAARKHDLHHEKFMLNFGSIGLMDWLHGTNHLASEKSVKAKKQE